MISRNIQNHHNKCSSSKLYFNFIFIFSLNTWHFETQTKLKLIFWTFFRLVMNWWKMVLKISYIVSKLLCEYGAISPLKKRILIWSKKGNRVLNIVKPINYYWSPHMPTFYDLKYVEFEIYINEIRK